MNIASHLEPYAPLVLRVGLAFVFMWFGWSGVSNPTIWTGLVPAWTAAIAAPESLVQAHGIFELVFGLLLFAGIGTRIVATLLLINLIHTITLLSWGPIMTRDIAIATTLLSVALTPQSTGQSQDSW